MKQTTLFYIPQNTDVPQPLQEMGFERVQHTQKYVELFKHLYEDKDEALYNNSIIHPFSYLNVGVMKLYVRNQGQIIPVAQKFDSKPRYTIHAPEIDVHEDMKQLIEVVDKLAPYSHKPIHITDLTEYGVSQFKLLYGETFDTDWKVIKTSDDVIYDTELITKMEGSSWANMRSKLNRVKKQPNLRIEVITTEKHKHDAIEMFRVWKETQGLKYFRVTIGRDYRLIEEYWNKIDLKDHWGYIAYIDNVPMAVAYGCRSPQDSRWGVTVTSKALPTSGYLADYIYYYLIQEMYKGGIEYVNHSDLNYSAGIRKAKNKFKPVRLMKCYDLKYLKGATE